MGKATSFDVLPVEIAKHVCSFLNQSEVSRLTIANKLLYELVRPILYRHPDITTFTSLTLFQRTITQSTYMGKADHQWSIKGCLDQTKTMDITIDPSNDSARNHGVPPAAIMISRMIQAIVRRCPSVAITLRFEHCHCQLTPISVLERESFPRVTKLVIYVGDNELDGTHVVVPQDTRRRARTPCSPNAGFWRPFVNGACFPDCKDLEIRHYWATKPPANASLSLSVRPSQLYPMNDHSDYHSSSGFARKPPDIGVTSGLKRLECILLECPPELNSSLLMQLLGNPHSVAANLGKLELRYCNLDQSTISTLLYHAPPNLRHLVLICAPAWAHSSYNQENPHLCPLVREFAKNLVHLEFAAPAVCRELFFDDLERLSLKQGGVTTGIGNSDGAPEGSQELDTVLIRGTVEACRRQKRKQYRNKRVEEAIAAAKAQSCSTSKASSLFGGSSNKNSAAARAQSETELMLDQEEERRARLVQGSKPRWFRRIIAWGGLCYPGDTWAEIQLAADMEEEGVEWVVANTWLQVASQHSNGKSSRDIGLTQALQEKFDFEPREITSPVD